MLAHITGHDASFLASAFFAVIVITAVTTAVVLSIRYLSKK